jgi:hypothetical protein
MILWVVGILVLLWLIYGRYRLYQANKKNCVSCRSINIDDQVLTPEECRKVVQGDRVLLKKLGGKVKVKKLAEGESLGVVTDIVYLTEECRGGEVRSSDQIVYPVTGRRVRGKMSHQPVLYGEQIVAVVG